MCIIRFLRAVVFMFVLMALTPAWASTYEPVDGMVIRTDWQTLIRNNQKWTRTLVGSNIIQEKVETSTSLDDAAQLAAETVEFLVYESNISPALLSDVTVWILPRGVWDNRAASGYWVPGQKEIWLCPATVGMDTGLKHKAFIYGPGGNTLWGTFTHEIGHMICDKLLNSDGYDFSRINELGKNYLKLKQYPKSRYLSGSKQSKLKWEDRIAEWFAEDFRLIYSPHKYLFDLSHQAGPDVNDEVREWFSQLLKNGAGETPALTF